MARLPTSRRPCIRFLFVGSELPSWTRVAQRRYPSLPSDSASRLTPLLRPTVPLITARRGLSPPKHATCVAHKKSRTAEDLQCGLAEEETRLVARSNPEAFSPLAHGEDSQCYIMVNHPGLVLPADRLRAALPVGTNRAPSQCFICVQGSIFQHSRRQRIL
jgi:hypothetical protein